MKRILYILSLAFCYACNSSGDQSYKNTPAEVTSSGTTFYTHLSGINFYEDLWGIDVAGKQISKMELLALMEANAGFPVRLEDQDGLPVYKLYPFSGKEHQDIPMLNKHHAATLYHDLSQIGKQIPSMNLPDMNGKIIDLQALKGRVTVLKFWFISCVPCVAEFPVVNAIKDRYPNVNFISIATDKKEKLIPFLKRKELKYQVVPDGEEFVREMGISGFPTHIVVGSDGKIVSYSYDPHVMEKALAGM